MSHNPMLFSVCAVPAESVYPLRSAILLGGQTEHCQFSGDDCPSTLHLAAYKNERLVAVSTVCREALSGSVSGSMSGSMSNAEWRLRGVAVVADLRGYGLGRLLVKLCLDHVRANDGRLAWCTARETAKQFYESLQFAAVAAPFTLPSRGDVRFYEMHHVLPRTFGAVAD